MRCGNEFVGYIYDDWAGIRGFVHDFWCDEESGVGGEVVACFFSAVVFC